MASLETRKEKETFYGVEEFFAELDRECESEQLSELDSDSDKDYIPEDSFSESDEDWARPPTTKESRLASNTSPSPTPKTTRSNTPTTPPSRTSPSSTPGTQLASSPPLDSGSSTERPARAKRTRASDPAGVLEQSEGDMWHGTKDVDQVPQNLPQFAPKRPPGPQLVLDGTYSPLQLFQLFFSHSVVKTIVDNTNKYAELSKASGKKKIPWTPITVEELHSYISLVIYMGLVSAKQIVDYWSQKKMYRFPFPCSVMTGKRFLAISGNLRISDPQGDEENMKKKGTPEYDQLFKIKPLYTDILSACKNSFQPDRELSIGERMMTSKARTELKRCMKAKPTKWGYKLFVLADSASAYTWSFYVHEGNSTKPSGKGIGYDSVVALLDHTLLGSGYKVYMDNFYTSPTLFIDLLKENTIACGTLRSHQKGFPQAMGNDLPKKAKRGSIRWYRRGPLLFVKWMDTREVNVCSTMHKAFSDEVANRRVKNSKGEWHNTLVPIPEAVRDYNRHMGGVSHSAALNGYYNVLHKSKKWYKTFFFHFVDIAIINSFILHQQLAKKHGQNALTQKAFREALLYQLANTTKEETVAEEPTDQVPCMPVFFAADASALRRICELCKERKVKVKTPAYCKKCHVPLCLVPKRNCFEEWHKKGGHNAGK